MSIENQPMIDEYKRTVVKALNEYRARHLHEINELKAKLDVQRRIADIQSAILNSVCQQRLPHLMQQQRQQQQPEPPAFAPVVHAILALATAMKVAPAEVVRALAVAGFAPAIGIAIAMPHLLSSAPVAPATPALPAEAVAAAASAAAAAVGKKRVIVVPPRVDKRRRCAARPRLEARHSSGDSSISRGSVTADDDACAFTLLVDAAVLEAKLEAEKTMP
jgi:hypothetical protein